MHIIYHCYGGAHSSVTTASIHVGILSDTKIPTQEELLSLPYFDQPTQVDHGYIRYFGKDKEGNLIYIVGRRGLRNSFPILIRSISSLLDVPSEEIIIINTVPHVNWMMMLGGYTSRRLGWVNFGRPLVLKGTQKAFTNFVNLVKETKSRVQGAENI